MRLGAKSGDFFFGVWQSIIRCLSVLFYGGYTMFLEITGLGWLNTDHVYKIALRECADGQFNVCFHMEHGVEEIGPFVSEGEAWDVAESKAGDMNWAQVCDFLEVAEEFKGLLKGE